MRGTQPREFLTLPAVSLDPLQRSEEQCVDPEFRIVRPNLGRGASALGQLDLYVHPAARSSFIKASTVLRRRLNDVEQTLVGAHLELLARLLVDVGRAVDGELLDARGQRNGAADKSTRAPSRVGNVAVA